MHLQKVFKSSPFELKEPFKFAELLTDFGNHMWERGLYRSGIESLNIARDIYADNPGQDLMEQSKTITVLGGIFLELGISGRREGLDYTLECGALRQQHFDNLDLTCKAPDPDQVVLMANSWNDVACCMMEYGSFGTVSQILETSLQLKQYFGIKQQDAVFNYAENYKNLAIAKAAQGDFGDAIRLSSEAVLMIESDMGVDSAAAQSFRLHYAYNLYHAGRYEEALTEHERVRKARVKTFGDIGTHTLNSYYACSVVHQALGNLEEAIAMLTYCLDPKCSESWTPEYFARVKLRLADLLSEDDDQREFAQTLQDEALNVRRDYERFFLPFEISAGKAAESMVLYDHMIPIEGGRSTTGQLRTDLSSVGRISEILATQRLCRASKGDE